MKIPERGLLISVLAATLVGAGAGVIASIFTSHALDNYATALLGDRGFAALEPRKPNVNPLDYADAVRKVRDAQSRSVAVIALKTTDAEAPDKWIGAADGLGMGVVVSANGWVLTTSQELSGIQNPVTGVDVWIRGNRYAVTEVVKDSLTHYVLLKLANASGLSPVGFGASEDSRSGDMVFVTPDVTGIAADTLTQSEKVVLDGPQAAENYSASWLLEGATVGPVFATSGDLLGFVGDDGVAEPLHHATQFVQGVIRTGAVSHPALGVYVEDLSLVYNLDPEVRQGLSTGALVVAPAGKLAVPLNTPAAEAGLLAKDIITAVDGEAVTVNVSLAELLSTYEPGQTVRLSVVRGGAPIEVSVVLGDLATLVY